MAADEAGGDLRDLHLLLATDEQVQDDFAFLCDLLDESPSEETNVTSDSTGDSSSSPPPSADAASSSAVANPGKRKADNDGFPEVIARERFQVRQRQEIRNLKHQVQQLQATLSAEALKSAARRNRVGETSPWERAARDELLERNRAMAYNKQLKDDLEEQSTFLDHMQKLFKKAPQLPGSRSSDEWQACKLVAQRSLRVAAIHAIADRQFQRMQHAFIQAGMFNTADDHHVATGAPRVLADGTILLEFKRQFVLPAPFSVVGAACWDVLKAKDQGQRREADESVETIDTRTVYQKLTQHVAGATLHSNSIRRHYSDRTRDVVVWRTVLEDALAPHMSRGAANDEWGWIDVAPTKDGNSNQCRMTFLAQNAVTWVSSRGVTDTVTQLQAGIERFGLNGGPFREVPELVVSNDVILAHMARGKRFQDALQEGMTAAIGLFYQNLHRGVRIAQS